MVLPAGDPDREWTALQFCGDAGAIGAFSELPLLVELAEEKEEPVYKFLDKMAGVE